jgi:hypothetical protein
MEIIAISIKLAMHNHTNAGANQNLVVMNAKVGDVVVISRQSGWTTSDKVMKFRIKG